MLEKIQIILMAGMLASLNLPFANEWGDMCNQRWASIHSSPPWQDTDTPVIVENSYGKGRVIYSAAFKIKDKALSMPEDAITLIYGCNHELFDPTRHRLVSAGSCTTTALAHMVKPLIDHLADSAIMTASMSTVHAVTNMTPAIAATPRLTTSPRGGLREMRRPRSPPGGGLAPGRGGSHWPGGPGPRKRYGCP